jgi:F-box/leucine-rich repeat protein 2/20
MAAPLPEPPLDLAALRTLFTRLPPRTLALAACVCTSWRLAASSPALYRTLTLDGETRAGAALRSLALRAAASPLLSQLEALSLEFAGVLADADVAAVARVCGATLRRINLNAAQRVGDEAVSVLAAHCRSLTELQLYWNVRVTTASLKALAASPCAQTLLRLNLSGCKRLDDAGFALLAPKLSSLTSLDLTRCLGLGDGALLSLAASQCAVKLEWLSFYADSHFSSKALGRVLASCGTSLTFLDLCGIAIEDSDLLRLLSTAKPQLRSLNLTWCTALTDASLVPLLSSLPRLQWLSLHGNVSVTPAVLHSLQRGCGDSIHTLDVRGCSAIPADMRQPDALKANMPLLSVFVVHS